MLKRFNNFKIGQKLFVGFAAVIIVLIILSSSVFVNFTNYIASRNMNTHTYAVLLDLDGIIEGMINMETGQRGFSLTGNDAFLEPYESGKNAFDEHFTSVKNLTVDNPQQQANLDKIKQFKEAWQKIAEESIALRRDVVSNKATMDDVVRLESQAKGKESMDALRKALDVSFSMENKLMDQRVKTQQSTESLTKAFIIAGTIIAIILAILVAFFISRIISSGINKVTMAANKLSKGELGFELEATTTDEIGLLSDAFLRMKETLLNVIQEIKLLADNAIDGNMSFRGNTGKFNGDYSTIVDGINRTLDAVVQPIKEASGVLEEMAKGNLLVSVEGNYKGDHAVIKDAINNTLAAFNEVLGNINSSAEQVATGAKQVSASSQALSQGSTEQASSIEEITASIEEVASQTRQNATNANQANELASAAKTNAIRGNEQMAEMLKAMAEINDSSNNISKIIKVIDEIAFQTNILALNAAVEAARAGQHGKGFAVVAEEVRNLAARSANAAKETTAMIEGSIKKVDTGTKIANDTAAALNQIVDGVAKAAALVGEIATASNEQASGIAQVNLAITQVGQVVQTNSATSEESAAASEELSGQAELLKDLVSRYKLKKSTAFKNSYMSLSPEVMKMLEELSDKKHYGENKTGSPKEKIILNDTDYGKY